jgi:hypothetical protein
MYRHHEPATESTKRTDNTINGTTADTFYSKVHTEGWSNESSKVRGLNALPGQKQALSQACKWWIYGSITLVQREDLEHSERHVSV